MPPSNTSTGSTTSWTSQPGVQQVLGTAQTLFNSGKAWAPDTTSHVTPFATQTSQGLTGINNVSKAALPAFQQNFNRVNATVNDSGLNALQQQQVGRLQDTAGGTGYNADQAAAAGYLKPIASGSQLENNPYLEEVLRRNAEDIGNSANLQASAAGRYGSGVHQGVIADAIGDQSANLRYQDYSNQQARRDAAIQNLFGFGTTGAGQQNAAINQLFNAGSQQRQNVLAGTDQLSNAYTAQLQPYQSMLGVGKAYEQKNTDVLNDAARIQQARKDALTQPVNWLANLANSFQGGQQVNQSYQPSGGIGSAIGGALSGYDIFGGPLGAGAGALGGLFGL